MFFDTRVSIQSGPGSQYLPDADVKGVKTGISGKIHNDFMLKIFPAGTKCSLITFNSPRGAYCKKRFFPGSKDIRNQTNVNPLFRPEEGSCSAFPAPYHHEEGLCRSDPALCCPEVGLHIARSQSSERWSVTSRQFSAHLTATSHQNFL